MQIISVEELFDQYTDTLQQCTKSLLQANDEDIEYHVFEEFNTGAVSFLYSESLERLKSAGFISEEVRKESLLLRSMFFDLEASDKWNVESVRTSPDWFEIIQLSDKIKTKLGIPFDH